MKHSHCDGPQKNSFSHPCNKINKKANNLSGRPENVSFNKPINPVRIGLYFFKKEAGSYHGSVWPESCLNHRIFMREATYSDNKPFKLDMARCIIVFFLMLSSFSVFSQSESYNFSKLNTFTGLSHNEVNTILKDADGFLWFGTIDGLNRYDGYSYKIFRKKYNDKTSLRDNPVYFLYELPDSKMWVKGVSEACIYDSNT